MQRRAWWIGLFVCMIGSVSPAQSQLPATRPTHFSDTLAIDPALTVDVPAIQPPDLTALDSTALDSTALDLTALNLTALDVTALDVTALDVKMLMVAPPPAPSPYAPPEPEREEDGINRGGVNVDLDFRYLTDYVYRGVSHNRAVYVNVPGKPVQGSLHADNFQADTKLSFNLGAFPHPFVGVFANINDSDPLSRFQEIRPNAGFDYTIRPLVFNTGINAYIYPERERFTPSPNTAEVFLKLTLDDSYFFLTPNAILSPYVYGAYDYQANKGWYLEAGIKHDFDFQDFGVVLTPFADVAYISHFPQQFIDVSPHGSGFQHYDVGLTGTFSLNHLLKLAPRYGQFSIEGYLTYTSKFSNPVFANTELWGGVGLKYRY